MKTHKNVLATRVDEETYQALQRLAAATDSSLSHYAGQALADHVRKQQNNPGNGIDDEVLQRLEERLAVMESRRRIEMETTIKRLERRFTTLKAMIDALVHHTMPDQQQAFAKTVEELIRTGGVLNGVRP